VIKKTAVLALTALMLAACTPTNSGALPQSGKSSKSSKSKVSSCDRAREAFLTGSAADQSRALKTLQSDRAADATAREYAKYWLRRDKSDASMRDMDESLITTSCAI
jgi:uncharacterized protein YcfL